MANGDLKVLHPSEIGRAVRESLDLEVDKRASMISDIMASGVGWVERIVAIKALSPRIEINIHIQINSANGTSATITTGGST